MPVWLVECINNHVYSLSFDVVLRIQLEHALSEENQQNQPAVAPPGVAAAAVCSVDIVVVSPCDSAMFN